MKVYCVDNGVNTDTPRLLVMMYDNTCAALPIRETHLNLGGRGLIRGHSGRQAASA